jgi:hypothetical protein
MYGMLEALIDLQETQRYKEVHELVRFGHEYYPELHALYYLGFSHWFSPDDIETIEEEGVDALLNDYPLPKRAKMASSGEGSTVKTLRLTGIQYRITESDSQVKESSDRTAGAKKSRTKGGANQPPSKKPKAAGSKKRTSGK